MTEKIGVYVCHCGTNIGRTVDCKSVAEYARGLPNVVVARDYQYTCSDPGQEMIKNDIRELGLTRVVVASCSPLMHEPTFRRTVASAGLNPFLFQMANIREQCSWITEDRGLGTERAKEIVAGAVTRVNFNEPLEVKKVPVNPDVLIVGGGITGIESALQIADSGKKVWLVEKEPSIGGFMSRFDKTFPTLDCAACILTPKMVSVGQHQNIELLTYSDVIGFEGYVGNFTAKIRRRARYVDEEKCTGCGQCEQKCPLSVPSEFECGLGKRKAIYRPFPQAVPGTPVIDKEHCLYFTKGVCKVCQKFCPRGAIDFEQKEKIMEIPVGTAIIATGFDVFDAERVKEYGYGRLPNVITSLEFERLTHASGPTAGKILLKNGKQPESIAIIHCVGSRDVNYNEYCSRVCCMYSLKTAHLVHEKTEGKVYEFYIDMRAFGKGYEEFYKRLLEEDVTFIRGRVAEVTDVAQNPSEKGKLIVVAEDTLLGIVRRIPVDLVILSVGLQPRKDAVDVAHIFSISRSKDGFFLEKHPKLAPVSTAADGIFIAGSCQGPKDIPDSVAQGGAAAANVLSLIDRKEVELEPTIAIIDENACSGCKICPELCPYHAISFDEGKSIAVLTAALCKGCGVCVAACPSGAIEQQNFTNRQLLAEVEAVSS
ncbi:MAG TPA: CoB--CoM heterodisulfide reductase iron-sulfur subunit A family protein [Candidatus Acidoferrales bacterium]|nr:CoB--CoM heterodisulfide reductase iron-sulfur subunit A family protein [Candidatus Acidoferrales bacterium]